ncbi:hypothetical protein BCT96_021450 [Vibrio splendidus]|uniref:hypothetical protein n=1 Tax=Vibrio splendidus TaxID=29497 RepID=UPI000C819B00|nr:hypothetical protein [Vibrio splendidus]PMI74941.1 hypothetical protein BCU37_04965 [Vibrio splendidus]PMK57725.1 hypothetical protein BCT96_17805 [Vibrio splendidus]
MTPETPEEWTEFIALALGDQYPEKDNLIIKSRKSMNYRKEACVEFLEYAAIELRKCSQKDYVPNPQLIHILSTSLINAATLMKDRGYSTEEKDREAVLKELGKELGITSGKQKLEDSVISRAYLEAMMDSVYWCSEKNDFKYPDDDLKIRKKLAAKYGVKLDTIRNKVQKYEVLWRAEQDRISTSNGVPLVDKLMRKLLELGTDSIFHEDLKTMLSDLLNRNFSAKELARDWCRRAPDDEAELVLRAACNRKMINKNADGFYTLNSQNTY